MLLSAIRGKLAVWLLLLCIATSAAAQDPCSDVITEGIWVSDDPLSLDTTLDVAARFTVGRHDSPEIRVKLITRGAGASLVDLSLTGSTVTIGSSSVDCGSNGTYDPAIGTCVCVNDYKGDFCQLAPENCRDGVKNGQESGVDCGGPDCNVCTQYRWFAGDWGVCSVSCGSGFMAREVWCEETNKPGVALTNGECKGLGHDQPTENAECGVSECASYQWEYTEWKDCTAVCGGGTRTRDSSCSSSLATTPVSDSLCDVKEKGETSQDCNPGTCDTFHWVTDWGECDATCGGGHQSATLTCMTYDKKTADSSMCKDKPSHTRTCNDAACPVAEGTGKWSVCPWDACTTECGGSSSTMSGSQSRVLLCRDPNTQAVTDPALCLEADRPRQTLSGCNPMLCTRPYWMTTPWTRCGARTAGKRERSVHCHDTNGNNGLDTLCKATGVPSPVLEEACEVNACIPTLLEDDTVASWAAATSCPAPLLPLAVAATAWAVTPPGGPSRRVSLASSLAVAAWTVSRVDAQGADSSSQECTSPLEIELQLEFPRSGSLGYDQVMLKGGITLPNTVRMVGCLPGYDLQEATGLCKSSITSFDVYGVPTSKAFNKWSPDPRYPDECPTYIHDMFAVMGEDGKVYPTWHPPVYSVYRDLVVTYTCAFGHEHGDDPSSSILFGSEPVPFGFVNEQHYADDMSRQRHESHVGHKLQVGNDVKICFLNNQNDCEGKKHIATCQIVIKIHQGTSSADAFTNNLHEVFLFARCEGGAYLWGGFDDKPIIERDSYGLLDVKIKYLNPFRKAGIVNSIDGCPYFPSKLDLPVDLSVLPIVPADSPDGGGDRKMVDNTCVDKHVLVNEGKKTRPWGWSLEHWVVVFPFDGKIIGNPYMFTNDAARYYDASSSKTKFLKYFVDLCYVTGAKQVREKSGDEESWCEQVLKEKGVVTWDDPRSPWTGSVRSISPNRLRVNNPGPDTVFYSDTYGKNLVTDKSVCGPNRDGVGCLKQYIGVGSVEDCGADIFLPKKDWGVNSTHAPN